MYMYANDLEKRVCLPGARFNRNRHSLLGREAILTCQVFTTHREQAPTVCNAKCKQSQQLVARDENALDHTWPFPCRSPSCCEPCNNAHSN